MLRRAQPSTRVVRNRRRAAALAVVAALAGGAVLMASSDRGGPARRAPGSDLGEQSDAGVLGQAVEAHLSQAGGDGGAPSASTVCAGEARAAYGRGLGPLVYAATLRWQGTRAVALAYRVDEAAPSSLDHRVLVLAADGCRLLVAQAL